MGISCGKEVDEDVIETKEENNPFEELTRKERELLRDTWSQVDDAKDVIGLLTKEFIEMHSELKPIFGVKLVPAATMLQMPKLGAHVKALADFFEALTNMLGFLDNAHGALQLVHKVGRSHARVGFLQAQFETQKLNRAAQTNDNFVKQPVDYFSRMAFHALDKLLPHLTEDHSKQKYDNTKVRFALKYPESQITSVWHRFMQICVAEIRNAFEAEVYRLNNEESLKSIAPQQRIEETERRRKRLEQKEENAATSSSQENKPVEELYEDPF